MSLPWVNSEGHLSLIKHAEKKKQFLIVSIFVNPLQFDKKIDFKRYPRTIENDLKILQEFDIDLIFLPENDFSIKSTSKVSLNITNKLCGIDRQAISQESQQ